MDKETDMAGKNKPAKTLVVLIVIIALGATGTLAWIYLGPNATARTDTTPISGPGTVTATEGSVTIQVQAISVAEPVATTIIRNRSAGVIRQALPEGAMVAAGDALFSFDDTEPRKTLAQAELNLKQARINLEKARATETKATTDLQSRRRLYEAKAISLDQVEIARDSLATAEFARRSAELAIEQASLALDQAKRDLADTIISAGFAGVVSRPAVKVGDFVPANSQLASLLDLSRILFRAEVDEYDIDKLREGLAVSVQVPALNDAVLRARIELISPVAEVVNNISVFKVSVIVDNAEGRLRPGMSADVTIQVGSERGIAIPVKAVTTVRDRSYVDVLAADGTVETRRISIGLSDGRTIIVTEGLAVGDAVVVPGLVAQATAIPVKSSGGTSIIPISVPGAGQGR
jgi:HlyD family secretion protein